MRIAASLIGLILLLSLTGCEDGNISIPEIKTGIASIDGKYRVTITESSDPVINPGFVSGYIADDQGQRIRFCVQELKRGMFKSDGDRPCKPMRNAYACAGIEILHDLRDQPAGRPTSQWERTEAMANEIDGLMRLKGPDIRCPI